MTDLSRLQQSCQSKCSTDIYSKNIGMGGSSVNINFGNNNGTVTGSVWGDLGIGALDTATNLFAMAIIGKMASGETASSPKNVSASVAQAIATLPGQIQTSVASFNTKYAAAGVKIDSNGGLIPAGTTYSGLKTSLETQISNLEKETISDEKTGKVHANYQAYTKMQTTVSNLESAQISIGSYESQLNSFDKSDIKIGGGGKAEPRDLSDAEIKICKDACSKGQDYTTTNTYNDIKAGLQAKADAYNSLLESKNNACKGLRDKDGNALSVTKSTDLDKPIEDAKTKLNELGKSTIDGKADGTKCADHDDTLAALKKRLAALGTEAEFNASVNEIKNLNMQLSNALQVRSEETDVDEANNRVKANKKKGSLLHRLFGKKSQANKDARANRAIQVAQRDAAYAAYAEKWFK